MSLQFDGRSYYYPDHEERPHLLLLGVSCLVDGRISAIALLDTASQWCVLPPEISEQLGCDLTPDPVVPPLHSRFGTFLGRLERIDLEFPADDGSPAVVSATCFVSRDWPGPVVIGWKGCLERMRFAVDPSDDTFHFAAV
jgi:hypothetical protein